MAVHQILPPNSGPFEVAVANAMDADPLVDLEMLLDPMRTTEGLLPFLAVNEGVELWYNDWTVERKRAIVSQWSDLIKLRGTFKLAKLLLEFVDAEVVDRIAYPARFVIGKSALNVTPLDFPAFKARYLVKVTLERPANSFELGRSALGNAALRSVSYEPIRRAKAALLISKAPETEYTINTAWRRQHTLRDSVALSDAIRVGAFRDRNRL